MNGRVKVEVGSQFHHSQLATWTSCVLSIISILLTPQTGWQWLT